jgi:predicted AAA+ superfamily ATPase
MEVLIRRYDEKFARTQVDSIRDFVKKVDWNNRLIGIKGARGVGKTTLVLQYIKKFISPTETALYASLDHLYFLENKLYDLAEEFYQKGGKLLALDEVHRYPNWSTEIKNIYDDFPDLKVIFTGSSLLQINKAKADLSRRAVIYNMPGLSFREYLQFETGIVFNVVSFTELLENHRQISSDIIVKIKPMVYFHDYLKYGYFPFYLENRDMVQQKLGEVLNVVLDVDIPQYEQVQISNIILIKKLLLIIAESVPFKPNFNAISQRSGISINTIKKYITYLNDAELILLLHSSTNGLTRIGKPDKIYLNNSNYMYSMVGDNAEIGNIRETFFYNQVCQVAGINAYLESDFLVNNQYTFEIGGKNKKYKQISGVKNSFLVKDDIETGYENTIPLWLFGFLY